MLFWRFGNPLIWAQELQRGGDVRREKSSGRSVMGIYSWFGAWNLNRQRHCSGQVLRGGQTGCMMGKGGGGSCRGGNRFWGMQLLLMLWQDDPHEAEEDRKPLLEHPQFQNKLPEPDGENRQTDNYEKKRRFSPTARSIVTKATKGKPTSKISIIRRNSFQALMKQALHSQPGLWYRAHNQPRLTAAWIGQALTKH